jgi:saccharopine dehydrogenase (NAD+, L-lysine-forming)
MTFGEQYLTHLRVLENVGMTRIDPVLYEGKEIVPLKFLKALLPDPASLAGGYHGKTCIGCMIKGKSNGKPLNCYIYNVCDHAKCYRDIGSQAIAYTTGIPVMVGAMMMLTGVWRGEGVFNVEEFDPEPFLKLLPRHGLPWVEKLWR